MTDNVITLPRRDGGDVVWVCNCGSTTHYHHADGRIACGACDAQMTSLSGDWRLRFPPPPAEPAPLDAGNFKVADFGSVAVFFRRQLKCAEEDRPIAAALVFFTDGSFSIWGGAIPAPDQKAWISDMVDTVKARFAKAQAED